MFNTTEKMSYLSGRPLHAITVNLARQLSEEFDGDLPMSFSAGADCFNSADLLAAGMQTITVCSDLLKTGGYLRLLQYIDLVREAFILADAADISEFAFAQALKGLARRVPRHMISMPISRINLELMQE